MILVDKDTVDTEGKVDEIGAELACAIAGVFDSLNDFLDESLALKVVRAAINTAADEIKEDYGVSLFENASCESVVNVQVIKVPKDDTNIAEFLKKVESYRKAKQGADANA